MHHAASKRPVRSTHRSSQRSLSPYFIDECALTVTEINRARAADVGLVVGR
jgi:hypothetical protein